MIKPLFQRLKKNPSPWSNKHTQVVKQVKYQVKELPCLGILHPEAFPIIETDASNVGYGEILKQEFENKISIVRFYSGVWSDPQTPYEALYGRPCRSLLCWIEVGESSITGPDLIRDTLEKVSLIRQRLLMAQSRQKSYVDVRRRPLEFEGGDHVFLKLMSKRGVIRFGKRGKLSSRFIGPFEILERVGTVAYRLALPPACQVSTRYFTSPCSGSILQIQLMWWIGDRLRLTLMGHSRRDQCVFWIIVIRFCDARP